MSPAARISPDVARVHDAAIDAGELDTFSGLGIEVVSRDRPARHRGADIAISTRGHRAQGLDGVHSANVGNSYPGGSLRSPMTLPLVAPAFVFRGAASLPVGAAGLPFIVSPGEAIVIAAGVFGRTGD